MKKTILAFILLVVGQPVLAGHVPDCFDTDSEGTFLIKADLSVSKRAYRAAKEILSEQAYLHKDQEFQMGSQVWIFVEPESPYGESIEISKDELRGMIIEILTRIGNVRGVTIECPGRNYL